MAATEFTVSPDALPILAHLVGRGSGPLSPWSRWEPLQAAGDQAWATLASAGLCAGPGLLKQDVSLTLERLLNPSRLVRVRLMTGAAAMEHIVYFHGSAAAVSFTARGETLLVRDPAPLDQLVTGISEYWGYSQLVSSGLKLKLDPPVSLAFAALADLHRRQVLADRAAMQPARARWYPPDQVQDAMDQTPADGQWLVASLRAFTGLDTSTSTSGLAGYLERLVELGVAARSRDGYRLGGDGQSFAGNFLTATQVLRLEVCSQGAAGEVTRSAMVCLQAGLHDNLYLDREKGLVILEAVSSRLVVDMVETFLDPGSAHTRELSRTT